MTLSDKTILVTGGTGSFGKAFVKHLISSDVPFKKLIVFSRDELKQYEMAQQITDDRLRFFLGDIRDLRRLYRAFDGVDVVVHAAALKQVPAGEYNPTEFTKTNVGGVENVVEAALDRGVKKVIGLSTDKAVNPINLYGSSKLCGDRIFIAANNYAGSHPTRFSVVRYGNVVGSRGSVVPLFKARAANGEPLPVTDPDMSRFWITMDKAVCFVEESLGQMQGREIFVPKIPSATLRDIAEAVAPGKEYKVVGIRPGEKLHEILVSADEAPRTWDAKGRYIVMPEEVRGGLKNFVYASNTNPWKLKIEEIRNFL